MQVTPNSFNPMKGIGSIVPNQEFAIYSDVPPVIQPTTLKIKTEEEASIEIQDLELLLEEQLPQYQFTGSLEHGQELTIRQSIRACHIHIFDGNKLCYRYSTDIREYWLGSLFFDSFFFTPIFLIIDLLVGLWYLFDHYSEEKAFYIGQDIQQVIEKNNIDLESYTENMEEGIGSIDILTLDALDGFDLFY